MTVIDYVVLTFFLSIPIVFLFAVALGVLVWIEGRNSKDVILMFLIYLICCPLVLGISVFVILGWFSLFITSFYIW